jgi:hypothetical protein
MSTHEQAACLYYVDTCAHAGWWLLLVPGGVLSDAEGCQQGAQRLCRREGAQPDIPAGEHMQAFMHIHACRCFWLACTSATSLFMQIHACKLVHMYTRVDACVHQDITVHQVKVSGQHELG